MLIILDRDGVINVDSTDYIKSPVEWIPIPGSLEAIAKLNQAGHIVVIASNQSGLARGYFTEQTLNEMHAKMQQMLQELGGHVDGIFYCPHHPSADCFCRKPKPGLLFQIVEQFASDFSNALVIGDSWRDIQAAQAVNCKAILVESGKGASTIDKAKESNIPIFVNLAAAVDNILQS